MKSIKTETETREYTLGKQDNILIIQRNMKDNIAIFNLQH